MKYHKKRSVTEEFLCFGYLNYIFNKGKEERKFNSILYLFNEKIVKPNREELTVK